jgi:hypothetical protein
MTVIRILLAASLMTPVLAGAQMAPSPEWPVTAGSAVRVESPVLGSGLHKGSVVTATNDTLLFQPKAATPAIAIATPNIIKLEIARGQHTNKAHGALLGFLIGAGAGAVLGAATYQKPDCTGFCVYPDSRSFDATVGAILLGSVGAVVGALMGSHPTETWVPVAVPRYPR